MTTCEIILTWQIFMTTCQIFMITCQVCRLVREKLVLSVNCHWTQVWHRNIWCMYSVFTFIDGIYIYHPCIIFLPYMLLPPTSAYVIPLQMFVVNSFDQSKCSNMCSTCRCTYNIDMYFKTFCSTKLLHSLPSTFKKIEPCEGNLMLFVRYR